MTTGTLEVGLAHETAGDYFGEIGGGVIIAFVRKLSTTERVQFLKYIQDDLTVRRLLTALDDDERERVQAALR